MPLRAETVRLINQRAQRISDEHEKKIAKEERAKTEFEAHKTKIRQGLEDLDQQLKENPELQQSLEAILKVKDNFKIYHSVKGLKDPCAGVQITRTSGQIAILTPAGVRILEESQGTRWVGRQSGLNDICYELLDPKKANVDGLFPDAKFPDDKLPEAIIDIVL